MGPIFRQRVFLSALAICLLVGRTAGAAPNYCDDKIEPGESPDGKGMLMMHAVIAHKLAQRHCGAAPASLVPIIVVIEEGHGCGPRSELESKAEAMEGKLGKVDDPADDRRMWGQQLDKEMVQGYGGCDAILKFLRELQDKYRNPPKWPRDDATK